MTKPPQQDKQFAYFLMGLALLFGALFFTKSLDIYESLKEQSQALLNPSPTPVWSPRVYPSPQPKPKERIVLVEAVTQTQGTGEITSFYYSEAPYRFAQWKNLVFYPNDPNEKNSEIWQYDLETNEKKVAISLPNEGGIRTISDLTIIDNTLFFSQGGYLTKGATYWVDLPITRKPTKLLSTNNGRILKKGDLYLLRGGDGDGCGGFANYHALYPETKTYRHLVALGYGCVEGESDIGIIEESGDILLGDHVMDEYGVDFEIYKTLSSLHIASGKRTILIDEKTMPEGVTDMEYFANKNIVLVMSKKGFFVFDLSKKELNKILDFATEKEAYHTVYIGEVNPGEERNTLCLQKGYEEASDPVELHLDDFQLKPAGKVCSERAKGIYPLQEDYINESLKRVKEKLTLPEGYDVILDY
jgi:hypothetical protein